MEEVPRTRMPQTANNTPSFDLLLFLLFPIGAYFGISGLDFIVFFLCLLWMYVIGTKPQQLYESTYQIYQTDVNDPNAMAALVWSRRWTFMFYAMSPGIGYGGLIFLLGIQHNGILTSTINPSLFLAISTLRLLIQWMQGEEAYIRSLHDYISTPAQELNALKENHATLEATIRQYQTSLESLQRDVSFLKTHFQNSVAYVSKIRGACDEQHLSIDEMSQKMILMENMMETIFNQTKWWSLILTIESPLSKVRRLIGLVFKKPLELTNSKRRSYRMEADFSNSTTGAGSTQIPTSSVSGAMNDTPAATSVSASASSANRNRTYNIKVESRDTQPRRIGNNESRRVTLKSHNTGATVASGYQPEVRCEE